jgi:hypothetical protein
LRLAARLALCIVAVRSAAAAGKEITAPRLPGGITDPAGRTGFLVSPSGTIDAVDLVTGDILWTADSRRPLFANGERLYALTADGNRPRLRAYDLTSRGERVFESEPLTLPEWAPVVDGPDRSFTVRCRQERGTLVLLWEARQPREGRQAAGTARVDLRSGAVTAAAPEPAPADPARKLATELEKLAVRWQGVAGKDFAALVLEQDAERQKFVLHSWDLATGKPNPPRELLAGRRLTVLPTADERFLCLRDTATAPDPKGDVWSIFAVATGELAARAPLESGTQAIALIGSRVYYLLSGPIRGPIHRPFVHPRSLKAIDLKTGKTLWERPVEGKQVTPPG